MLSAQTGRRLTVAAVGVCCAAGVAVSGELSVGAHVAVLATGIPLAGAALVRRSGAGAAPARRWPMAWLVVAVALAWEAVALAADGLPTISDLLDPVLAHPLPRAAATLGWFAAGVWLARRPERPAAGPIPHGGAMVGAMHTTAGRTAVMAAWLWLGVHFLAR